MRDPHVPRGMSLCPLPVRIIILCLLPVYVPATKLTCCLKAYL